MRSLMFTTEKRAPEYQINIWISILIEHLYVHFQMQPTDSVNSELINLHTTFYKVVIIGHTEDLYANGSHLNGSYRCVT